MTLTADQAGAGAFADGERRARSREPRRSWASTRPYDPRATQFNGDEVRAHSWHAASRRYRSVVVVTDAALMFTAGAGFLLPRLGNAPATWFWIVLGTVTFGLTVMIAHGYDLRRLGAGAQEFQSVAAGGALLSAGIVVGAFSFHATPPRTTVFVAIPLATVLSCLTRYALRKRLHHRRLRGADMQRTVVLGSTASASRVAYELQSAAYEGYEVVGLCLPSVDDEALFTGAPVLGAVSDVVQIVNDYAIEVVVLSGSTLSGDATRRLSWALDRAGAALVVIPDLVEVSPVRLAVRPSSSMPMLEVEVVASRRRQLAKTAMDCTLGPLIALVTLPLVLVLAVLVRLTSRGPAFFRQHRVGVDGRRFSMWKLRSMYVDADERRAALAELDEGNGVMFKMRDDPRVTPLGRLMRRYSLDELPQLWNVLSGDMSLVGPRPPLTCEVDAYEDVAHRRLRVKPGITGLWQISGRSDLSWEETVRLDLRYADNWSVAMDLTILWKTARAVVRPEGAY
ncbi:sugar transferase [Cellulomonas sp. HZM]|uniref:sugar transferase n=1 Tax=Cellulomonas sp. HZM TaxID=1454010 RepID=UPI0004931FBE|nr:sugar transferase [Cellulomonas sp. HZM]